MDIFKRVFKAVDETTSRLTRTTEAQQWLDKLADAEKREKAWRGEARRVTALYEQQSSADDSGPTTHFNILYANTETLAPAVYNNTPRPVVKRKVDKSNPIAIAAAQVLKGVLTQLVDDADREYMPFDELQKIAVQEALVPGRGLCKFSYKPDVIGEGPDAVLQGETICGDSIPWNRVVYGYAKQWCDIPFQAFEHFMTREECEAEFGEKGKSIKLTHTPADDKDDAEKNGPEDAEGVKFAHIWEIWDKTSKKVIFVSEGSAGIIETRDDPLGLQGFFPSPRPIQFLRRISSLVPQTLYQMYEEQAKELEDVTKRIGHITRALKIRGFYDGTLEGLDELLKQPENTFMPARNVAAMQQGQTLEKSVWFMPLEPLVSVLQQLYLNRTQIIGVIHQITGVADIMRGASAASETLGAQKMKEAWGTMRLKRMQKEVQRFTRECFRIQAELAAKHFGADTLAKMSGMQFPKDMDKQMAQNELMPLQQQAAMAQQSGQPIPPEMVQQGQAKMAELQSIMQQPSWEQIEAFLRDDDIRNFVIDIETNSTVDIEATEDKQELAEMMNSMAQLLNGVMPMVKEGVMPFDAAKSLMLTVVSKFRLGDEVEETFRAMQQPQPKADPAQQKVEAEMKRDEQKFGMEQESAKAELAQKQQLADMEMRIREQELRFQERELQLKMQFMEAKHAKDMEMLAMKAIMPPAPPPAAANNGGQGE
jgi:hypothetical protein